MATNEKNDEIKKEIKVETPINSVSYTGVINVSLQKGKKTYFKKQFKNKGRWPLFYFLNMCLRGDYGNAELYRPKYINAFGNATWENNEEPNIVDGSQVVFISDYFNDESRITVSSYPFLTLPDIEKKDEGENIGSSTITYKFNIPFSQITSIDHVNAFALYAEPVKVSSSGTARSAVDNPCAFFFITQEVEGERVVVNLMVDDQGNPLGDLGDEYNLYIEWTLSISNSQYKPEIPPNNESINSSNNTDTTDPEPVVEP